MTKTKVKKLDAIPFQNGAITVDGLKATKTSVLKRELKALQSAIYKADCFGVNDLQLASMIGRELERRDTERKKASEAWEILSYEVANAVDFFQNDIIYEGLDTEELAHNIQDHLEEEKDIKASIKDIIKCIRENEG